MDKKTKLILLEKLHSIEKASLNNKEEMLRKKDAIISNRVVLNKLYNNIAKAMLLFTLSTASIGTFTYGGYVINKEITSEKTTSDIDAINEENIISKVLRLLAIITLMTSSDLLMEEIFISVGLNKKDMLGFLSAISSIRENVNEIKELKKQNKDYKKEIKELLTKTNDLLTKYHAVLKKLEEENILIKEKNLSLKK